MAARRLCLCELDPAVVLMGIRMSVMDGVAATRKLTRLGARARVLILTHMTRTASCTGAAGRRWGFLLETMPPDQLVSGIETGAASGARRR